MEVLVPSIFSSGESSNFFKVQNQGFVRFLGDSFLVGLSWIIVS